MKKNKAYFIAASIVVGLICIVLAVNIATLGSQLKAERANVGTLNRQIVDFEKHLSDADARHNEQTRIIQDLQDSLGIARREVETLRAANSDLEARLNAASAALQALPETPVETVPETPVPAAE